MGALFKILPWFQKSRPIWLGVVVTFIGVVASLVGYAHLRLSDHHRAYETLERLADRRLGALESTVRAYSDYLAGFQLLLRHSDNVTFAEFQAATHTTIGNYPGLDGMEWAERVPTAELPALAAQLAEMGLPPFVLKGPDSSGGVKPISSERSHALPIIYIVPEGWYPSVYGFDLLASTVPGPEIKHVQSTGQMFMSRTTTDLLDMPDPGFVVYVPVFDPSAPLQGEGRLRGILIGVFRMKGFSHALAENLGPELTSLIVQDETAMRPDNLRLRVSSDGSLQSISPSQLSEIDPELPIRFLSIWGRTWRLTFEPDAGWAEQSREFRSEQLLIFSIAISFALGQMIFVRGRRLTAVEAEVQQRTAELHRSQQVLESIVNHNPAAIWLKDTAGRFQVVNSEFCSIYGRTSAEIVGHTDQELYPCDVAGPMENQDRQVMTSAQGVAFEDTYEIRGQSRTFVVNKFPLIDAGGAPFALAGIATDITSLRKVESEQRAIERKLLEAQKLESLGVMAGGIAHDFNNLLTGVLGNAELINLGLPPEHTARPRLESIRLAAHRAAELCQQLLAYTGHGHFREEPLNLSELVTATVSLLEHSVCKSARLIFELAEDPPRVLADSTQMRQIIMNLVINASEALPESGGDVRLRTGSVIADAERLSTPILGAYEASRLYSFLEVTDTGCGMSPETLERIFDPFYSTKFTGRGLGLAAVSGIVRGHRGALTVTSRPGQGTTFRLLLPTAPDPVALLDDMPVEENVQATADEASPEPVNVPHRKVLIVDDEPGVLEFAKTVLLDENFAVETAANGLAAKAAFDASPDHFDLILLDLTMPGLSGTKVLEHIRRTGSRLPVLLMSGYSQSSAPRLGGLDAQTGFLAKPFDGTTLRRAVRDFLDTIED